MTKEFTIDRRRWLRGEGGQVSRLVRERDGKMCCLGFFGAACGVRKKDMLNVKDPGFVDSFREASPWLFKSARGDSEDCVALMHANDTQWGTEVDRERTITMIFAEHGVKVRFVG